MKMTTAQTRDPEGILASSPDLVLDTAVLKGSITSIVSSRCLATNAISLLAIDVCLDHTLVSAQWHDKDNSAWSSTAKISVNTKDGNIQNYFLKACFLLPVRSQVSGLLSRTDSRAT